MVKSPGNCVHRLTGPKLCHSDDSYDVIADIIRATYIYDHSTMMFMRYNICLFKLLMSLQLTSYLCFFSSYAAHE